MYTYKNLILRILQSFIKEIWYQEEMLWRICINIERRFTCNFKSDTQIYAFEYKTINPYIANEAYYYRTLFSCLIKFYLNLC